MRRRVLTCAVSAVLLATGAGCDADGADGGACADADSAVVKQIKAGARKDFRPVLPGGRPGVQVDHLELHDSSVGKLPAEDRKFGAEQLLAFSVTSFLGGEDAADGFGSVEALTLFALDGDGKLLGPADPFTASLFDLTTPADPGWLAWGDKRVDSPLASELFDCVDPD